jgi:hypothetical protein
MSSPTKQLKEIRRNKLAKQGRMRKRKLRANGSTPPFPIHPEENKSKK